MTSFVTHFKLLVMKALTNFGDIGFFGDSGPGRILTQKREIP